MLVVDAKQRSTCSLVSHGTSLGISDPYIYSHVTNESYVIDPCVVSTAYLVRFKYATFAETIKGETLIKLDLSLQTTWQETFFWQAHNIHKHNNRQSVISIFKEQCIDRSTKDDLIVNSDHKYSGAIPHFYFETRPTCRASHSPPGECD